MSPRACLICTARITDSHLGFEACRACAAFFIRTVNTGRKFICRQGDGKCVIRKHEKFICRSCRYDKCVESGLKFKTPRKRKPRRNRKATVETPNTSSSSSPTTGRKESLIDRMEIEYKAWCDRRIAKEKEYVAMHNLPLYNHPTEEVFVANFKAFYELFRIAIKESSVLPQRVFDDFDHFPIDHRVTLFKNFITKFSMIECTYYTTKYFKGNQNIFMASLITCGDINNYDQWMAHDQRFANNDTFHITARGYTNDYKELFGSMSKMDELTEREFHALAILNYCDIDTSLHLPDEIIKSAQEKRAQVFSELQEYYRNELKLTDFSKRIGNMMLLAHGAGETGILMNEEMRMYATMFDLYAEDKLFREFFTP